MRPVVSIVGTQIGTLIAFRNHQDASCTSAKTKRPKIWKSRPVVSTPFTAIKALMQHRHRPSLGDHRLYVVQHTDLRRQPDSLNAHFPDVRNACFVVIFAPDGVCVFTVIDPWRRFWPCPNMKDRST